MGKQDIHDIDTTQTALTMFRHVTSKAALAFLMFSAPASAATELSLADRLAAAQDIGHSPDSGSRLRHEPRARFSLGIKVPDFSESPRRWSQRMGSPKSECKIDSQGSPRPSWSPSTSPSFV